MDLEKFIREVTRKPGVSGYEAESGAYIAEQFRPLVDSVEVDVMQNVIARVGTEGPRVMISAHQDEIGVLGDGSDDLDGLALHLEAHHVLGLGEEQVLGGTNGVELVQTDGLRLAPQTVVDLTGLFKGQVEGLGGRNRGIQLMDTADRQFLHQLLPPCS